MSKCLITEYEKYCLLCGRPTTEIHHLIFGSAWRKLSDEDNLVIPLCRNCHDDIHNDPTASRLSKILGQVIYEKEVGTREQFRARYSKSYL